MDIVFLVDRSCAMTEEECRNQQYMVAESLLALRGETVEPINGVDYFKMRVAYSELFLIFIYNFNFATLDVKLFMETQDGMKSC